MYYGKNRGEGKNVAYSESVIEKRGKFTSFAEIGVI